jgi:hypothetical protein
VEGRRSLSAETEADGVAAVASERRTLGTETYHVVPVEDWITHQEHQDACVCGPHVEYFPGGTVVVHHALDGRNKEDPMWPRRRAAEVARTHLTSDEPA